MSIIRAQGLGKTYQVADKQPGLIGTLRHFVNRRERDVRAVDDVSFSIEPGEIVGFLGANGAGKTTTLKMLTRPDPPHQRHGGGGRLPAPSPSAGLPPPDHPGDGAEAAADLGSAAARFPAGQRRRLRHRSDAESRRRIAELAEMLELGDELRRPVRKLSLGQRMKAELLAALLHRPAVLFLDEPTLGLDVNAQARVRSFLADYNRRFGATVLLTSHYMADITALCPRVLLIHEGQLFYDGTLETLTQRLAPCREVRLELHQPIVADAFAGYGEVEAIEGREVRLLIPRERLTEQVGRLLADFDVVDLSVGDPPIEDIIGRLFRQGELA